MGNAGPKDNRPRLLPTPGMAPGLRLPEAVAVGIADFHGSSISVLRRRKQRIKRKKRIGVHVLYDLFRFFRLIRVRIPSFGRSPARFCSLAVALPGIGKCPERSCDLGGAPVSREEPIDLTMGEAFRCAD